MIRESASKKFPSLLIRASAGTGKTFSLTNRILELLFSGEQPDKILACTFTKKAASEIEERLLKRLSNAYLNDKEAMVLEKDIGISNISKERIYEILLSIINKQHLLSISTLDSFFSRILKLFSYELGISPNWQIAYSSQEAESKTATLEKCLSENLEELTEIAHTTLSQEPSKQINKKLLGIIKSLENLYRESTNETSWSGLPENNESEKAIEELYELIRTAKLPTNKNGSVNSYYLKESEDFLINVEHRNWHELLRKGIGKTLLSGSREFRSHVIPDNFILAYNELFKIIRNDLARELNIKGKARYCLLNVITSEYLKLAFARKQLSFADISYLISNIFNFYSTDELYYRLDRKYSHLLLDEFQDTALSQWDILSPMVREIISKGGYENSFFCVGDTKQAIYGWRGGVSDLFYDIEGIPGVNSNSLETSYRSSPPVIELVNKVFLNVNCSPCLEKFKNSLDHWAKQFKIHSTALSNAPGYVYFDSLEEELAGSSALHRACLLTSELHKSNSELTIGILVRENKEIPIIRDYLRSKFSIQSTEEGGNPLIEYPIIRAIISLLRLADHPECTLSSFHVTNSLLGKIFNFENYKSLIHANKISLLIRGKISDLGFGGLIVWLEENLRKYLSPSDKEKLSSLVKSAFAFDECETTIRSQKFIDFLKHEKTTSSTSSNIRVMTIHASKGLEFDAVVLPKLSSKLLKSNNNQAIVYRDKPTAKPKYVFPFINKDFLPLFPIVEEAYNQNINAQVIDSLNILYVALTRAKYGIYIFNDKSKDLTFSKILEEQLLSTGQDRLELGNSSWHNLFPKDSKKSANDYSSLCKIYLDSFPASPLHYKIETPSLSVSDRELEHNRFNLISPNIFLKGKIFHAFFEKCYWLDENQPSDEELLENAKRISIESETTHRLLKEFKKAINYPEIKKCFIKNNYSEFYNKVEVKTEYPFVSLNKDRLLVGRIDRIIFCYKENKISKIEIYDIKTSKNEGLHDKEQKQIEIYRQAISSIYKIDLNQISAELLYV